MQIHKLDNDFFLLEIEEGQAWIRTNKWDAWDAVPALETREPVFKFHVFSMSDEYGERKTISVSLSQDDITKLMELIADEVEKYSKIKTQAEDELAEIMKPAAQLSNSVDN